MRGGAFALFLACALMVSSAAEADDGADVPIGQGFDFYVLSLSWSPSYCAAEGEDANRQQCGPGRPYAFVVHGLWPEFEHGYPDHCASREPDRVPSKLVARLLDLMPSAGLIGYQWRKHGACSGLSQEDYFAVLRAARDKVAVPPNYRRLAEPRMVDPDRLREAFVAANPGLKMPGVSVSCDRRYLREVRICMTKDLRYRPCTKASRDQCRLDKALMPPNRGG